MGSEDSGSSCCPPVVDSATWLAVVGGIAIVTFFLRMASALSADITLCYIYSISIQEYRLRLQAITMNIGRQFGGRGQRRRRREAAGSSVVSGGGVSDV